MSPYLLDILFDSQTSKRLLIAVPEEKAEKMVKSPTERGIDEAAIIGEVVNEPKERKVVSLND